MQYLTAITAAILPFIAVTSAAPPAANHPNSFMKRDVGQVTFCTGTNSTGECSTQTYATNQCIILPAPYNGNVKTFIPDHGNL